MMTAAGLHAATALDSYLRELLDKAEDAFAVISYQPVKRYVYVNEAQCRLTGYTREEWYEDPELAMRIVHPEDLPEIARMRRSGAQPIVMRIIRKDGSIRWTESRAQPVLDARGQLVALQSVNRDVTERKLAESALQASEARYRAIVDTMLDQFSIYRAQRDPRGAIVDFVLETANEAAFSHAGRPREEMLGRRMSEFYPGSLEAPMFREYARILETGAPLSRDGERGPSGRYYDVRAVRLDADHFSVAFREVTERVRAEAERRSASVTKALVRGLVRAVGRELPQSHALRRSVGQSMGRDLPRMTMREIALAFDELGLGQLRRVSEEGGRFVFEGADTIDREAHASGATCYTALGFLEGALGAATGQAVLGSETSCQSRGHATCRFVLATRG